jgi:glycosyltransferase involved in cell wall biosynthesis
MDAVCAIDLDTILPVYLVSRLRGVKRVYDAHELFCEMEEVVANPTSYKMWKWIERFTVPHFKFGYTVNKSIAQEFKHLYNVDYAVVRSATVLKPFSIPQKNEKYILYQGAVNKGRCFDKLIPAMKDVNARLIICGEGNYFLEAQQLVQTLGLQNKIIFKGYVPPEELTSYTANAYIGITLFVATSKSNELSLANRFSTICTTVCLSLLWPTRSMKI